MKTLEHNLQCQVIQWFNLQYPKLLMFAIPNGGSRGGNKLQRIINGSKLKREGVISGIPDLFLAYPTKKSAGLFIELKVKPNKPSTEQKEIMQKLITAGYACVVCYSLEETIENIKNYLTGN